jgi:hypothetical protein
VRVTLVHELTHALQDQRFDLDKLDHDVVTSGQDFALTALVEGDAVDVEDAYLASLPQSEQDDYDASLSGDTAAPDAPASSAAVPPILELFESSPYIFGPQYIAALKAGAGQRHVDRAFEKPPTTEEQIMDPVAARSNRRAAPVAVPKLEQGEKREGTADDFGAMSLYLVLASRLDPKTALAAAEGWGGDRSLAFTQPKPGGGRQECLRVTFRGDTNADTTEIADALGQWSAKLAGGAASVQPARSMTTVTLTACDTGGTAAPTQESLDHAVSVLANRNDLTLGFLDQQAPIVNARCVADRLVGDAEVDPLLSKDTFTEEEQTLVRERISQYITACQNT